jgi:hypothetical protein
MFFEFHCGGVDGYGMTREQAEFITDDKILANEVVQEFMTYIKENVDEYKQEYVFAPPFGLVDLGSYFVFKTHSLSGELKVIVYKKTVAMKYTLHTINSDGGWDSESRMDHYYFFDQRE